MRKNKKNIIRFPRSIFLAGLVIFLPALTIYLFLSGGSLEKTGGNAAVISAAINMPEGGLKIMRERFLAESYTVAPPSGLPLTQPDEQTLSLPTLQPNWSPLSPSLPQTGITPQPEFIPTTPLNIPEQFKAALLSENFSVGDNNSLIKFGAGLIKNDTKLSDNKVASLLETPLNLGFSSTDEPQVLIIHTHATEAFEEYDADVYDTRNTWRNLNNNRNMVAVGDAMKRVLDDNSITTIHDTTQHDYPSYNGSYERSAETIKKYLEEYPSIKVVLDLHRDAMERENSTIIKPVAVINEKKAAQIMIIAACDNGSMNIPNYPDNLRFAASLQSYIEADYPELTRPVYFCYRKYNMDLSKGSLLIEFGSNANTLEEAVYSAEMAGQALSNLIKDSMTIEG